MILLLIYPAGMPVRRRVWLAAEVSQSHYIALLSQRRRKVSYGMVLASNHLGDVAFAERRARQWSVITYL
jgi:hypothetical protein